MLGEWLLASQLLHPSGPVSEVVVEDLLGGTVLLVVRVAAALARRDGDAEPSTCLVLRAMLLGGSAPFCARGVEIPLTRTQRRLLRELAAAEGAIVTREELLERAWGYSHFGDARLLEEHVRRLLLRVERDAPAPEVVLTVRGVGYRLGR